MAAISCNRRATAVKLVFSLYPIRFVPIFRRYIWGGRRLKTVLGKNIGEGGDFAESWEVADHDADQSVVAAGPAAGKTLAHLVARHGAELLGRHHLAARFPLLFKFLDAHRDLSVQVHPDDAMAARLDPPDLGKTEAWVVLAAEPGSLIYAGLRPGVDRAALARQVARGAVPSCLHRFEPSVGDCVFLAAGAVHALGRGLLVAEIQQASDATFRLFDWNRVGADGKPRALHIEQALEAIDYGLGPVGPVAPRATRRYHVRQLAACDKFVLDRWRFDRPEPAGGDDRFHILAVLEGSIVVEGDPTGRPLTKGGTILLPASAGEVTLRPEEETVLLDTYLP